jgi:hypothetical protein
MGDGTVLNDIYIKHLHKANARDELAEAEDMVQFARDQLMILAACSPHEVMEDGEPLPWVFYVRREVHDLIEAIEENAVKAFCARHVVEEPEHCRDDLVPSDWDDGEEAV